MLCPTAGAGVFTDVWAQQGLIADIFQLMTDATSLGTFCVATETFHRSLTVK